MKVRVRFTKQGAMRFIGHLDVMRYFQKAIRRAELPAAFSGGYSPHMIMSFALPLGLGIASRGEYFDLQLTTPVSSREGMRRLNEQMADGVEVLSFLAVPEEKKYKAMTQVAAADYRVRMDDTPQSSCSHYNSGISVEDNNKPDVNFLENRDETGLNDLENSDKPGLIDLENEISRFMEQKEILVEKETKSGAVQMDIRPWIHEATCKKGEFFLRLSAGSLHHTKPELVMQSFCSFVGIPFDLHALEIERLDLYQNRGDETAYRFESLEYTGEEIVL